MTLELYKHGFMGGFPAERTAACAVGGTLIVANTASSVLNVPAEGQAPDPWFGWVAKEGLTADISNSENVYSTESTSESGLLDEFAHTTPNHGNIRPIDCMGWNYMNLYHIWRDNNTNSTAPRVMVLGRLPKPPQGLPGGKKWPNDDDPAFPDLGDMWVPLTQPGETTEYIEFPTTAGTRFMARMFISAPSKYIYLQGCTQVMVFVTKAAAFTNTQLVSMSSSAATITEFSSQSSAGEDTSYGVIAVQFSG